MHTLLFPFTFRDIYVKNCTYTSQLWLLIPGTPYDDDVLEQDDLEKDLERIMHVEEAQEHDMDIADSDEANKE